MGGQLIAEDDGGEGRGVVCLGAVQRCGTKEGMTRRSKVMFITSKGGPAGIDAVLVVLVRCMGMCDGCAWEVANAPYLIRWGLRSIVFLEPFQELHVSFWLDFSLSPPLMKLSLLSSSTVQVVCASD